ncbi:MAG: InlB B-repeat-containing protein [Lachnospiraceae bacterium]|nr:InlB B-repeat-containing protein [Lachnospiraceae bacterium]
MRKLLKSNVLGLILFCFLLTTSAITTRAASVTPSPGITQPPMISVDFNLNYKTSIKYEDILVTANKKYGKLPAPSRKGYTFQGWYTSAKKGTKVKSSTRVKNSEAHTLYAHWKAKTYKVKLNARGGKVSKSSYKKTYGSTYGKLSTPTKKGYKFLGWFTKKSGGTQILPTSKVKITKTTTLYAHWDYLYPEIILKDYSMTQSQYNAFPYVQTQTAYQKIMLGNSSYSLARSGCLTCNIALIMTYRGNKTLPTELSRNTGLYTSGGLLIWGKLPDVWTQEYCGNTVAINRLYTLLSEGKMASVCLKNSYGGMHWVTVYGYSGSKNLSADKFLIFDPGKYSNKTLQDVINQKGNITRIIYIK